MAAAGHPSVSSSSPVPDEQIALDEETWAREQKPLGDAAWIAESRYPDDFTYAYFASDPSRLVIGFRAVAPSEVRDALEATGLGFVIEENVGVNYADVHAVADSVVAQLPDPGAQVAVGADPERGPRVIAVTVFTADDAAADEIAARAARLELPEGFSIVVNREYDEIKPL